VKFENLNIVTDFGSIHKKTVDMLLRDLKHLI